MKTRTVTVLLVEDEPLDHQAVMRAFKKHRIANPVVWAKDGREALDMLRADQIPNPFLILLDLNMPRMGGLEFLEELRKDPDLHASVVFVLTTSELDADRCAAYAQHVAGYVTKGRVGPDLLAMIDLLGAYWRVVELPEATDKKQTVPD